MMDDLSNFSVEKIVGWGEKIAPEIRTIFKVLYGHRAIAEENCDTTDIYKLHHDFHLHAWEGYYRAKLSKVNQADICMPHGFCPTLEGRSWFKFLCGYGFYNNKRGKIHNWSIKGDRDVCFQWGRNIVTAVSVPPCSQNSRSPKDCLPCPVGDYCMAGVKDCEPGYYCPAYGLPKEPWPGFYAPNVGMVEPTQCPPGTYQNHIQHIKWNSRGISQCQTCPQYMFCDVHKLTQPAGYCDDGWFCGEGESAARPPGQHCQPGHYCVSGRKFVCPEGTYQPNAVMHECFECPEGKYCSGTGLTAPSGVCDEGWYCNKREITSQPNGNTCVAGNMCTNGMMTPCGKGYYQPNPGQTTCIPCPIGKYCSILGLTSPNGDCNPGCCLEVGQISQDACPPVSPSSCTQGFYEVSGSCVPCITGMYCSVSGLSAPSGTCQPGWYCETQEISPTPLGKLCPAGYKCPSGAKIACTSQAINTEPYLQYFYQPKRGQLDCVVCPDRYDCKPIGMAVKGKLCTPGYRCHSGLILECKEKHFCYGGEMLPCRNGFTTTLTGQDKCVRCAEGKLCENGEVLPCPDNMVCFNGYAEYCELGYECYFKNGMNLKTGCAEGTERYDVDSSKCVRCRKFRYCRVASSYECFRYHAGFGCAEGTSKPYLTMAKPGNFYHGPISTDTGRGYEVKPCPIGRFHTRSHNNNCLNCQPGKYCDKPGLVSPAGNCDPGFFCAWGSTNPRGYGCIEGHYCVSNNKGVLCDVGTYQPNGGQPTCLTCPTGYFCNKKGLLNPVDICPVMFKCPEGTGNPVPCNLHTHQDLTGQAKCVCNDGYICENVDENPVPCPIGHFCLKETKIPCAPRHYQSELGSTECLLCEAGTFEVDEGSSECDQCEAGSYQPDVGSISCLPCAAGTFQSNTGMSSCSNCAVGTYQDSEGMTSCKPCDAGTFGPNTKMAKCLQCTGGYYCSGTGLTVETAICWIGHECPKGSSIPSACQSGFYQPGTGAAACRACPVGFYCNQAEAQMEKQSGVARSTHGVVTPKPCPYMVYCGLGSAAPVCDLDPYEPGELAVTLSCTPSCRPKMTRFGNLRFKASCDNCGSMISSYQWSMRQCTSADTQSCRHCVGHVTYLTGYTGNYMLYNQQDTLYDHTQWTLFSVFVKVTLQNGAKGMAHLIWEYIEISDVQCQILPVTGIALVTDFSVWCSDPELPDDMDYTCSMFYSYSSVDDTIIYKTNSTCNQTGVMLRQGDKSRSYRQHLKVAGKYIDHILWKVQLILMVDVPPMTTKSIGTFIDDVGGTLSNASNDKEVVESLNKLQGLTYVLNEDVDVENETIPNNATDNNENKGGVNDTDTLEEKRKENTKIRDTIVSTISQVNTTNLEVMTTVTSTLNQVTLKKDELSPKTKEKTYEMYNTYTKQFQEMESTSTTLDEEVTTAAKTLLFGVASIIDIVTDDIEVEDDTKVIDEGNEGTTVSPQSVKTTTPSPKYKKEKEKAKKKVKERTEKLLKSVEDITDIVLTRQDVDAEPTTVHTPIMSISVTKMTPSKLVGTPIKAETSNDDTATSLTFPDDLQLSEDVGSVGTEFVYMKKNPYVWAENSKNIQPPILSMKLKDSKNNILNISNLTSPIEVNLASDGGTSVGNVPVPLTFLKSNHMLTMLPSLRKPCAATFELTVQRERAIAFTLSLPNNFTSVRLSVGLEKFNVFHTISSGYRYPEDINIIREFYGKLSESDEIKFDDTSAYCQNCSESCCNTTEDCEGIYKHCIYYCKDIVKSPFTDGCSKWPSPVVYCQDCQNQCCNESKNCTGNLKNCEMFCNISMEQSMITECREHVDSVAEKYTNLTENVTNYCKDCREKCCNSSEECTGIYSNCLYFCENMMFENVTTSCMIPIVPSTVETIYLFTRSHLTEIKKSHKIYFGLSIDPTDERVIQDLIRLEPRCLGNETLEECLVDFDLPFPLRLSALECKYWDEPNQRWSEKGLEATKDSHGDVFQCASNHLTSFGKFELVAPSFIDPLDFKLFLTFFENPVVVTMVVVVWMIYFFLVHWARQKDKLDTEQIGVIYCADNVATHTYTYLVCIVTGWWNQAGTTANVYIYLKGTTESSPRKCLKTPIRKCFQTGYEDWFLLTTENSLGDIKSVTIWHDNTGSSPHWYVNQVFVKDMQKNSSWTFIYNDWLAADRGSLLLTTTTLMPVTEEELKFKRKYNFVIRSTQDLRDGHIWLSIFSKPASSMFTRVQRLTCCLTLLLTTMLTNIMFYGIPTDNPEDQVAAGNFKLSLSQIIIGIESSLIMFPVNLLIVQLFLKVKPKPQQHEYNEPKPVEYFLEGIFGAKWQQIMANIDKNLLELTNIKDVEGMKVFSKVPRPSKDLILDAVSSELSNKIEGKVFPWWFVYVAWVISMMTCMISSYFVMLYGLKYGYTRSVEWLVSFFVGFFQSVFVQQPLKVLGIAVLLTLILKKTPKFEDTAPHKERDRDEEYLHSVCITPPEAHQLVMEPLPKRLLNQIRNRLKIEWLMDVTLRDMIFHAVYLIVILIMVHGHRDINQAFRNTETVRAIFVKPSQGFGFEQVSKREDFYTYLQDTVVPAMLDITANHDSASLGSNHYLVGTYRLRQLRMKQEECKPIFYNLPRNCKEPYWIGGEDTKSFNRSWSHPLPENVKVANPDHWDHRSAWELGTLPYPGAHATYSGGGYVVDLPPNVNYHSGIFSHLESTEWIDGYTRAVFLEFTLYNPNVDLFTVVVYLFEFSTVGRIFPMHHEFTSKLYHYSNDYEIMIACCEVIFFCFNIAFVYVEIKKLRRKGKSQYFSDFWSYIEIVQISLAIVVFGLFLKRVHAVNSVLDEFKNSKGQYFVNFYSAMFWDFIFGYISASLIGLVTIKTVKHLRYNKRTRLIATTLGNIKTVFLGYVFMFAILTIAFAQISYLMFGSRMQDYRTFADSWCAIIIVLMGQGDYLGLQSIYRIIGMLFIVAVIMLCQYGLMVMMITILNVGRLEARYKLQKKKNKFELLNYIGSKVKLVLDIK